LKQRSDFTSWQKQAQTYTEQTLIRLLPPASQLPAPLIEAMHYVMLDGGKRLRPMLVLAAAELGNAITEAVDYALAAVECIHIYSLVHDDMPEMDNDSLRHGKAACHIQYTPATALLVGDAEPDTDLLQINSGYRYLHLTFRYNINRHTTDTTNQRQTLNAHQIIAY